MASEGLPIGMAEPTVATEVGVRPESPEIGANALSVASRLLCGAATFFFLAFLFAYFYLRSVNIAHMWRPAHTNPDKAMGVVFVASLVISVILAIVAGRQMKGGSKAWIGAAAGAVVLGIVAVIAQCIGYTSQNFGPTNGAYASVFCAWTAFYLIAVLATMYWLETQVATELRARRSPAGKGGEIAEADRLIAPSLDAAVFFWAYLGALGVVMYVTLYLL